MMITDINEDEIKPGARVEYVGDDDARGVLGTVEEIYRGVAVVLWDWNPGMTFDIRPTNLALVTA